LMPETLRGLWKQRLRWAQGGAEIFLKNFGSLLRWRNRRMWPLLAEFLVSTLWAYAFVLSILLFLLGKVMQLPPHIHVETLFPPAFTGLVLGATCLLQFAISIYIDRRYEKGLVGTLFWVIWYPLVFWMTNLFTSLVSFPKVMLRRQPKRARWVSPDRGIQQLETP
ncbi:MAG: poly-beta-1,6 N-acetyl-D-glucosamine synthase, partial [Pseudomonas sp.]